MSTTANSQLLIIFFSFADGPGTEHQISVPLQRLPNRAHSQVRVAFGGCNLTMVQGAANKRQVVPHADEPRSERVMYLPSSTRPICANLRKVVGKQKIHLQGSAADRFAQIVLDQTPALQALAGQEFGIEGAAEQAFHQRGFAPQTARTGSRARGIPSGEKTLTQAD
jgi:hypothetical protein